VKMHRYDSHGLRDNVVWKELLPFLHQVYKAVVKLATTDRFSESWPDPSIRSPSSSQSQSYAMTIQTTRFSGCVEIPEETTRSWESVSFPTLTAEYLTTPLTSDSHGASVRRILPSGQIAVS
jgi:hypothetical protein